MTGVRRSGYRHQRISGKTRKGPSLWAKQPEHPLWRAWESPLSEGTGGPAGPAWGDHGESGQRGCSAWLQGQWEARRNTEGTGGRMQRPRGRPREGGFLRQGLRVAARRATPRVGWVSGGLQGGGGAGGSSEHPARCSAGWEDRGFPQRHGMGARGDGQPCTGGGVRAPPGSQPGLPGGPRRTQMCEKAQMRKMYFQTRSRAVW